MFNGNFLYVMHGFQDIEVLFQAGFDLIVISPLEGASGEFSCELWKSDHDFLIVFHSKLLSVMHGFRENEVLFQAVYDVMVIFPLGGASGIFRWRILKWPWLPDSVPYQLFS